MVNPFKEKKSIYSFLFFSMNYLQDIIPSQNTNLSLICSKELSKDLHWNWQLIVFLIIVKTLLIHGNVILTYSIYFIWSFFYSLIKDKNERPKYKQLLEHPFLDQTDDLQQTEHAIAYLSDIMNELKQNTDTSERHYNLPSTSQWMYFLIFKITSKAS
jgi:hypothetical protein